MSPNVDGAWFKDELARIDSSVRRLAKHLHMDPSAVSRRFKGEHKITLEEAAEIAKYIGQPLMTVIHKAGLPESAVTRQGSGFIKITEITDPSGIIYTNPDSRGEFVQGPADAPDDTIAIRFDVHSSPVEHMDGWVAFYVAHNAVSHDSVGRLCVVELPDEQFAIRIVKRVRERGMYRLISMAGIDCGVEKILSASPILWIKTY